MKPYQLSLACFAFACLCACLCLACPAQDFEQIARKLPPAGIPMTASKVADLEAQIENLRDSSDPDIAIFIKAVRFALLHDEFYKPEHYAIPSVLLTEARRRLDNPDWDKQPDDIVVRGYRSKIDGSVQPYGLEIPDGLDLSKPVPLWVWLHGRGDKETDLHFIHNRMRRRGQVRPENAIVLHPFGRQCIGWKWGGEVDVFEAIADVAKHYKIDQDRIALLGFSMGGAGAWHIGAHYTDHFACVHPGAGFAETKDYNKLKPADYPSANEQTLWAMYDVPAYARNFLTVPLIAYSGENDKQIQAARVMETALLQHDYTLKHVIGAKMGHKYDDVSIAEVTAFVDAAVTKGRQANAHQVHLQTQTLRYAQQRWITLTGLEKHWNDSRVDATITNQTIEMQTKNVTSLQITARQWPAGMPQSGTMQVNIDGAQLQAPLPINLIRDGSNWAIGKPQPGLRKSPGMQGPIDDAFLEGFLIVTPTAKSADPDVQRWVDFELAHQLARWRALFRGEARSKPADQITDEDVESFHLVLWGDRAMNPHVASVIDAMPAIEWNAQTLKIGNASHPSPGKVLTMIYPNPQNPNRYVVLNSGPTFREGHDRTNSLQNAKLPDWAIIGLNTPPSATAPGAIHGTGFFDENWQP